MRLTNLQNTKEVALVVCREVHAARATVEDLCAHGCLSDCGCVDDWCHLVNVLVDQQLEQRLVAILQTSQVDVLTQTVDFAVPALLGISLESRAFE